MGEILLKKIDILRDEIRWWLNVILVTLSALIGGVFSISQNKLDFNIIIILIVLFLVGTFIYSVQKINNLQKEINIYFKQIKKEKR